MLSRTTTKTDNPTNNIPPIAFWLPRVLGGSEWLKEENQMKAIISIFQTLLVLLGIVLFNLQYFWSLKSAVEKLLKSIF